MNNFTRQQLIDICERIGPEEFRATYGKLYTRTRIGSTITAVKALRLKRFAESLIATGLPYEEQVNKLVTEGDTSPSNAKLLLRSAAKRVAVTA